jgi:hypothetical protein
MKFELILAVDSGDGQITNVSLAQMTRPDISELATLGLSLSKSKQLLAQLQHEIVTRQFEATTQQRRHCGQCGTKRAIKDFHGARFRSLFGDVERERSIWWGVQSLTFASLRFPPSVAHVPVRKLGQVSDH